MAVFQIRKPFGSDSTYESLDEVATNMRRLLSVAGAHAYRYVWSKPGTHRLAEPWYG